MICLYKNDEQDYIRNGSYILNEAISCIVYRELNSQFKLELIYPLEDKKGISKYFEEQMIIKANTPKGYQLFRISNIKKDLYNLTITAYHISYDLRDVFIDNINTLSKNRTNTINYLFNNTMQSHKFIFDVANSSDNGDLKDFKVDNNNLLNVLLGDDIEGNIGAIFGQSEFDIDNYTIKCVTQIGEDKGYLITDNKNLINIDEVIDSDEIITRIMPEGKLNENGKGLRLDELFVDSPLINKYNKVNFAHIIFNEVEFEVLPPEQQDNDYEQRKQEAQEKLRKLAKELYSIDNVDKPTFSLTVDFEDLQHNYKYRDLKHLYSLNLGDTVRVKYNKLNIDIKNRVKSYEFDAIEGKYSNITLGTILNGIAGALNRANSSTTKETGNSNGLLGRVEDIEKGFSEIEQNWNKVEFRFGSSNINRIKNGAFLAGLDFWNINNEEYFSYKTLKDNTFQSIALKIGSTLNYEHKNKGYVLSDEFELKKNKPYTLSFKVKLESNVKSATVSILRKAHKDDLTYTDEFKIGTFTTKDDKVFVNEKFFKDFTTNDLAYMCLKVVNEGVIDDTKQTDNNAIFTEFALYEGYGYKPFDYNDALYEGITKIDANGVEVSHTKIKTKTRMSANGFHILDLEDNILGSFASDLEYSTLFSDYVYASNIKNAVINKSEQWLVSGNKEYNADTYESDKMSKIFNDDYKCAKNRINSPLNIDITNSIDDYTIIEGFDGSPITINLEYSYYNGNIEIKNCNSLIKIKGNKYDIDLHSSSRIFGQIKITNCKNVIIEGISFDALDSPYSLLENDSCIKIDNSNVFIKNCDINNYFYGIIAENNSTVGVTELTGSSLFLFNAFNNSHIYVGNGEDDDVICPVYSIFNRVGGASTLTLTGKNGALVQKDIGRIPQEERPELQKTLRLKIRSDWGEFAGKLWDAKNKKWLDKREEEKFICGNKDGKYLLSAFNLDLDILDNFKGNPLKVHQATLKVRLKVNSYSKEGLPLYMFAHHNEFVGEELPLLLMEDFKQIGTVYLSKDNYIDINEDIIYNLIIGGYKGLAFGCYDMTEEKVVMIDPKSIEFIVRFSVY